MRHQVIRRAPGAEHETIEFRSSLKEFLLHTFSGWFLIALTVLSFGTAAMITVPIIFFVWLDYSSARYWLDGDRLFMRRGLLSRSEEEIELYRIKDIKATFSIVQQRFDNGDIEILSSDATGQRVVKSVGKRRTSFVVRNVKDARAIREELRARVEDTRRLVGVREIDLA